MTPHLESLFEFLRFPSISTDSRHRGDVRACADWLTARLSAMGLSARVHETPGHPVVIARNAHQPGRPTVLIPIINTFKKILGAETLMLGLALPNCRIHAPNENFTVENFESGLRLNAVLLEELAAV